MRLFAALLILPLAAACGDDTGDTINQQEVITTLTLTLTPDGGGAAVTAAFDDPDGDGGSAPTIDAISLADQTRYTLTVTLTNKLAEPDQDITAEVQAESGDHQLFFSGSAIDAGTVAYSYGDKDGAGYPVGLSGSLTAQTSGSGQLTVTLRHVPPVNGAAVKTATLADDVKAGGIGALPGQTDVSATFDLTVQ